MRLQTVQRGGLWALGAMLRMLLPYSSRSTCRAARRPSAASSSARPLLCMHVYPAEGLCNEALSARSYCGKADLRKYKLPE